MCDSHSSGLGFKPSHSLQSKAGKCQQSHLSTYISRIIKPNTKDKAGFQWQRQINISTSFRTTITNCNRPRHRMTARAKGENFSCDSLVVADTKVMNFNSEAVDAGDKQQGDKPQPPVTAATLAEQWLRQHQQQNRFWESLLQLRAKPDTTRCGKPS